METVSNFEVLVAVGSLAVCLYAGIRLLSVGLRKHHPIRIVSGLFVLIGNFLVPVAFEWSRQSGGETERLLALASYAMYSVACVGVGLFLLANVRGDTGGRAVFTLLGAGTLAGIGSAGDYNWAWGLGIISQCGFALWVLFEMSVLCRALAALGASSAPYAWIAAAGLLEASSVAFTMSERALGVHLPFGLGLFAFVVMATGAWAWLHAIELYESEARRIGGNFGRLLKAT